MFIKGYTFSQIKHNNKSNFKETAIEFDGDTLQILENTDGNIQYDVLPADNILKMVGMHEKSLIERLEDDFINSGKSDVDFKPKTISKTISKTRSKSKIKSKPISKTRSKSKTKSKSKSKSNSTRKHMLKKTITPDFLKTIY